MPMQQEPAETPENLHQGESRAEGSPALAILPSRTSVKIAGVDVSNSSASAMLKAACEYLQVSQSGSKQKMWNRILGALDRQAIQAERELAAVALDESQRKAESVQVATPPDDQAEIDAHMLTHLPYAAWCPACVMSKGRPELRVSDPARNQRRELPVISFDFCFTGKSFEHVTETAEQSKLTCLLVHCLQTGAVHCIPVQRKGQTKYLSQEIMRLIDFLGHIEVTPRCDQEHSTLSIQNLVRRARQRLNLKTVIEDAKVMKDGSNAAVEKAIDRARKQASVLLRALTGKIGFEVKPQHPLFAWAFVHAGWVLTRFSVKAGVTPYELVAAILTMFSEYLVMGLPSRQMWRCWPTFFTGATSDHQRSMHYSKRISLKKLPGLDARGIRCKGFILLNFFNSFYVFLWLFFIILYHLIFN